MATEVVKIVDPDNGTGTDYTSLEAFMSGEDRDLVLADEIAVAKCRCTGGTADNTPVTCNGFTADATRRIKVWTDPAESYRHNGTYQTGNKYRLESSVNGYTSMFRLSQNFVDVIGIQLSPWTTGTATSRGVWIDNVPGGSGDSIDSLFDSCIFKHNTNFSSTGGDFGGQLQTVRIDLWLKNCLFYDFNGDGWSQGAGTLALINCTAINCGVYGFQGGSSVTFTNCIAQDCGTCFDSGSGSSDYNLDDDNTAPGSNSQHNKTLTFKNKAGDDFHLAATDTDAIGNGVGPSVDSDVPDHDVDRNIRSGSTCDIGFDEFVPSYSWNATMP